MKVTVLAVLVLPTATVLKLKLLVESVTGALPVPVRLTVCGLVIAVSVNVRTPAAEPRAVGVNVTPTVQLAPAATLAPHVLLATANGPLAVILVKLSATFRRFVTVTVLAELVLPTANVPKLNLVDERLTGALPLPIRLTVWVPALSVIVAVPEAEPTTVGANVTWMVHDAAGAMLPVQLFVWLNGAVTVMLAPCNGPVPVLCSVMFLAVLVVPATCDEKDKVVGVTAAAGVVPVPLSVTTCAEPRFPESSLTFSAPVTEPTDGGVNVTDTVQFDPAGRTAGQLFVSENPPLAERFNPFSGLPPKFVMVMVCVALVVPIFCEKVNVGGEKLIAEGRGVGSGTGVAPKT